MPYKYVLIAIIVVINLFTPACQSPAGKEENTVPAITSGDTISTGQTKAPGKQVIKGDWTRTDGPLQLQILEAFDNGTLKAAYFNPKSINVAKATWITGDGMLKIYIELRDVNYPGSNYNLTYFPAKDLLAGKYYQAVEGVTYDVEFVRNK